MKKNIIAFLLVLIISATFVFAASYADNEYQKLANSYTQKAQAAFDEGEYDLAVEYTIKAEENAELSKAYVEMMLARADAETQIRVASNRITWAKGIRADVNFPVAFSASTQAFEKAKLAFEAENYAEASILAKAAAEALASVEEVIPLPKYYVVRPWEDQKDCYWNISGRSYVYDNPLMWENLYHANKDKMKNPGNPDLIYPGMKIEIPSVSGEFREGTYNPALKNKYKGFEN